MATCDAAGAAPQCEEKFCGGRLWRDGPRSLGTFIQYRIHDPAGAFSPSDLDAIRAGAAAWARETGELLVFKECSPCVGRFVSVVPADGDGIVDPSALEQVLPMPVNLAAFGGAHRIAHQWGHVVGLDDMYRRADRDAYVRFDPAIWCGPGRPGLPAHCAVDAVDEPGSPSVASGAFGPYDERSKMSGLPVEGICSGTTTSPNPSSGQPTVGDVSAVHELYNGYLRGWSPFMPVGNPLWTEGRRDYQLAPGVDPVGAPAIASWTSPSVDIFVRGSDNKLYGIHNELAGTRFVRWSDWAALGDDFDSDPAAVFADADTLYLVARSTTDGNLRLRMRVAGVWGDWLPVAGPSAGIVSAPAIAAHDTRLHIIVRGFDNDLHDLHCTRTGAGTLTTIVPDSWQRVLGHWNGRSFIGKPSAIWDPDGVFLYVTAVTSDHVGWVNGFLDHWGQWVDIPIELSSLDDEPSIAFAGPDVRYFAADRRGLLTDGSRWPEANAYTVGGLPSSAVSSVMSQDASRIDVAARIDDHGHPGVWWKFKAAFVPPCNYNAPDACAMCGCGLPGTPACDN